MKTSRRSVHRNTHAVPILRFEEQQSLTSFSGLVIFQKLFAVLDLKVRLRSCFEHLCVHPIFGHGTVATLLITHLLLGYRWLRDIDYYSDDPMVARLLGLRRLPDVATISRALAQTDEVSVAKLRFLTRDLILERLGGLCPARVTLDFDGSVLSTGRRAEGTAVGFNKKKKGQRSYYPLFCTVAQTGQVLDVLHRSGNVHDSRGAKEFIAACIEQIRTLLPQATIEVRMDSAFFSEAVVSMLVRREVEYTISVPFERLPALKGMIEARRRWRLLDDVHAYFERKWKPKKWEETARFVLVRKRARLQHKEPIQLDLFIPHKYGYEFKAIVTNKTLRARKLIAYHDGRGSQEGIFAELKTHCQLEYVPTRTLAGNQTYMLCAILAHNLGRELQMMVNPPARVTNGKRAALWQFATLETLRRTLVQRAGRLISPQGKLTLAMSANEKVRTELLHYLDALDRAA